MKQPLCNLSDVREGDFFIAETDLWQVISKSEGSSYCFSQHRRVTKTFAWEDTQIATVSRAEVMGILFGK